MAKGLKVPCLFMITEVSIRCQKTRRLVYAVYPRIPPPQYTTAYWVTYRSVVLLWTLAEQHIARKAVAWLARRRRAGVAISPRANWSIPLVTRRFHDSIHVPYTAASCIPAPCSIHGYVYGPSFHRRVRPSVSQPSSGPVRKVQGLF